MSPRPSSNRSCSATSSGAFTDAHRDKVGKLQLAHEGTVFLDEVAEMSLRMQALFLRFLENGEIQPVGADQGRTRVNVRVIAATNKSLTEEVAAGRFREDLMYRLDVVHVHVPPLRERRDDVRALIEHLTQRAQRRIAFSEEALRRARDLPVARQRPRVAERRRAADLDVARRARWI